MLRGSCPLSGTLASRYLSPGKSAWDRAVGPGSSLLVMLLPSTRASWTHRKVSEYQFALLNKPLG